ncbi:formyl transferase [uncultured Marivita sp.]|uniref:formyl transferase n=1 Tax=uncultured Marivita sp. TaxID=888080 RepID=UPI00262C0274|nr:formyl transferase [uncultured Marivita sp.]
MRLVVLASAGPPTNILFNFLEDAGIPPVAVLVEPPQSRWTLLRGRARKLGWGAAIGQVLFMILALPLLRRRAAARLESIREANGLRTDPIPADRMIAISSVNSAETRDQLFSLAPDAAVLSGTRVVKPDTLRAIDGPVLNIHAGITPEFRGVHGGYWALWIDRPNEFGATVHLVDAGVDTGAVLKHVRPIPGPQDNFVTYPLLQLAAALPALVEILNGLKQGEPLPHPVSTSGFGQQWYHPTLGQYFKGLLRGVR